MSESQGVTGTGPLYQSVLLKLINTGRIDIQESGAFLCLSPDKIKTAAQGGCFAGKE